MLLLTSEARTWEEDVYLLPLARGPTYNIWRHQSVPGLSAYSTALLLSSAGVSCPVWFCSLGTLQWLPVAWWICFSPVALQLSGLWKTWILGAGEIAHCLKHWLFNSQHPYGGSQVFVTQFQWVQLPHTNMHAVQTPVHIKLKTNKTLDSDTFIKIVMLPCTFFGVCYQLLYCSSADWRRGLPAAVSQGFFYLQVLGLESSSSHNCSLENCRSLFSMACS